MCGMYLKQCLEKLLALSAYIKKEKKGPKSMN